MAVENNMQKSVKVLFLFLHSITTVTPVKKNFVFIVMNNLQ